MKFKLNPLEKFACRHRKAIMITTLLVLALYFFLLNLQIESVLFYLCLLLCSLITLAVALFMLFLSFKIRNIVKLHNEQLDMQNFLEATNLVIDCTNPKDTTYLVSLCYNRIAALYNMGEFDLAEKEIGLFLNHFNLKKINLIILFRVYALAAQIALYKNNFQIYNEFMRIIHNQFENPAATGLLKKCLIHDFEGLKLSIDAITADKSTNGNTFESRVFTHFNTTYMGKQRKKPPTTIEYIGTYYDLFIFFKNTGDAYKASFYAQRILALGNHQLIAYRKAKEYLENANQSN